MTGELELYGQKQMSSLASSRQRVARLEVTRDRLRSLTRYSRILDKEHFPGIARELDDDLQMSMTALRIHLGFIRTGLTDEQGGIRRSVDRMIGMTNENLQCIRGLSSKLNSRPLGSLGITAELESLASDLEESTFEAGGAGQLKSQEEQRV